MLYMLPLCLSQLTGAKDYRIFTSCIVAFSVISLWIHEYIRALSWTGNVWLIIPYRSRLLFLLYCCYSLIQKDKLQDE